MMSTETISPERMFDLRTEPWIPVRALDGSTSVVGLSDVLLRAGDWAGLAETSPPNLVALHRILLAVLHRALAIHHGPWTNADRCRWFDEGLPAKPVAAYLEQWQDRLWLVHPEHPFLQVAALASAEETRDKVKPWTQLELASSSGNAPVVFDHALDDAPTSIPLSVAARTLAGFLAFTPGGLVKTIRDADKAGPLANTAAVLPTGDTLAQTLLLCLHPYDGRRMDDLPSWERPAPSVGDLRGEPQLAAGPNDRYSRRSRAVLLMVDRSRKVVQTVRFAAGQALNEDAHAPDPMAAHRINKDGKAIRLSFYEGRALWRDLPALVPDSSGRNGQPAQTLTWAADLLAAHSEGQGPCSVMVAGVTSDQAKILRWRVEFLRLPQEFVTDFGAADLLRQQIQRAETYYAKLRGVLAKMIASCMPDSEHKETGKKAREILANGSAAATYFVVVERALPSLMTSLAADDLDGAWKNWTEALVRGARQAWEASGTSLGSSANAVRARARAYPYFRHLIGEIEHVTDPVQEEA